MAKYRVSKEAENDLKNLWHYTAQKWSIKQAEIYIKLLLEEFKRLTKNPYNERNYSGVRKDYFGTKVKSHVVFFKIALKNEIEIIRVLHEKMDLKSRIAESD